jgi:NAD(P)-dependent dehydrogenase (short-subunit alcohol dehydrogenase family)
MNFNPMLMRGQTVLVTGASSGIGRETAILLSELEATVVLTGRDPNRLEETLSRMQGEGHRVEAFDLRESDAIPGWLRQITLQTGPLHGLVHSAGIHQAIPLRVVNGATVNEILHTNVTSAILLLRAFRQKGCSARGGGVVLLTSVAGLTGQPAIPAYSASKAALIGLARSAAMELAPEGLRVNCVAPGYVETEMGGALRDKITVEQFAAIENKHPLGIGKPRDVAHAVAFLLADTGRWITGTTLIVDGGYSAS